MRLRLAATALAIGLVPATAEASVTIVAGFETGHLAAPSFYFVSPEVLAPEPGGLSVYSYLHESGALRLDAGEMLKTGADGLSALDEGLLHLTGTSSFEYGGLPTAHRTYSELYLSVRTVSPGQITFTFNTAEGSSHQAVFDTLGEEYLRVTAIAGFEQSIESFSIGGLGEFDDFTGSFQYASAPPPPVPEPAIWAMMTGGFGLAGAAVRGRRSATASVSASRPRASNVRRKAERAKTAHISKLLWGS